MNNSAAKFPRLLALEKHLELPMLVLSFIWLCILIAELAVGSSSTLLLIGTVIWVIFILYFSMRMLTVTDRIAFFKKNWFFVLAILVSALRFFPFHHPFPLVRALTATFGIQVIWIFASADQGMRFLRKALGHRGAGYVLALTFVVLIAGSAGMLHFEGIPDTPQSLHTYSRALWWTAMQMTNISSSYSIRTSGGRILCLGISIYAAGMFGYLTALFATILIDRDAKDPKPELERQKSLQEIRNEVIQLRQLIEGLIVNLNDSNAKQKEKGDQHD